MLDTVLLCDKSNNSNKHGFTIAELCVVLSLTLIVTVMVVTFCVLVSERTKKSSEEQKLSEDKSVIYSIFDTWVNRIDSEEYVITNKNGVLTAIKESKEYVFMIARNENKLMYSLPEKELGMNDFFLNYDWEIMVEIDTKESESGLITCKFTLMIDGVDHGFTLRKAFRAAKVRRS